MLLWRDSQLICLLGLWRESEKIIMLFQLLFKMRANVKSLASASALKMDTTFWRVCFRASLFNIVGPPIFFNLLSHQWICDSNWGTFQLFSEFFSLNSLGWGSYLVPIWSQIIWWFKVSCWVVSRMSEMCISDFFGEWVPFTVQTT